MDHHDADIIPSEDYVEIMTSIEESLKQELENDIAAISEIDIAAISEIEFMEYEVYEAERLNALITAASTPQEEYVLCPLCRKGNVYDNSGCLVCDRYTHDAGIACDFCVDARGIQDPLALFRHQMCTVLTEHSRSCMGHGFCRLATSGEMGRLIYACYDCGLSCVVI